jgi:succinoglycan biosynthesis protein ExoU
MAKKKKPVLREAYDYLMINDPHSRLVDVIIAAWNRADTIERAVQSALAQEAVNVVIVIDDGSTDDTAAKASRCDPSGSRMLVERLPSNVGPAAARNVAIELSEAPWLAILDGDDFFLPKRIETLLSNSHGWDLIADGLLHISERQALDPPATAISTGAETQNSVLTFETFVLGDLNRRGAYRKELGFLKPLIRRSFLDRHKLRYDESLRLGEDYAFYARALLAGARFLLLTGVGYVSVERTGSISVHHTKRDLEQLRESDCNLMKLTNLRQEERRALAKHYASVDCRVQWIAVVEAIKARRIRQFITPFFRSNTVMMYLFRKFIEEVRIRLKRNLHRYN